MSARAHEIESSREAAAPDVDHLPDEDAAGDAEKTKKASHAAIDAEVDAISGAAHATEAPKGRKVTLGGSTHIVGPGDSLWSLADQTYGNGKYWREIKKANPGKVRGAKNVIRDGDELVLPELEVSTLAAIAGLEDEPDAMRDAIVGMTDEEYEGFLDGLSPAQRAEHGPLIQHAEMVRQTGMTLDEMGDEQKAFMEEQAAARGISVGELMKQEAEGRGFGGNSTKEWDDTPEPAKREFKRRFLAVIEVVRDTAPPDVKSVLDEARKKGGGKFIWEPRKVVEHGAFAFSRNDWNLYCGTLWVEQAEIDPARVYASIMHEMLGHPSYGKQNLGGEVIDGAWEDLSEEDQEVARTSQKPVGTAYTYMETEIFAELYEFRYDTEHNRTDHPFAHGPGGVDVTNDKRLDDVKTRLTHFQSAFEPTIARGLVMGLWRRVEGDPRIVSEAKDLFRAAVDDVFGFEP